MGPFQNRKLLSPTITFIIKKPPCPPQSPCFIYRSCAKPPPPPPAPPHEHRLLTTGMTFMACVLGVFFFLGIVCIVMRFRYLRRIESRRRNLPVLFLTRDDLADEGRGPAVDHPIWLINFVGLQQSVIDSIAVCEYKRGEGLVEGTECSVCLGEFEDGEDLRLLPKCSHAFHLPCIDTWLRSHKNCPLCRAPVVVCATETSLEETRLEGSGNGLDHQQVGEDGVDGIGDVGFGSERPVADQIGKNCDSRAYSDLGQSWKVGIEGEVQAMRRSVSMDASSASMIYNAVANVSSDGAELRELKSSSFKNPCKHVGSGGSSSSSGSGSGNSSTSTSSSLCRLMKSASLGCVVQKGPVSMKRSCSSRIRTSQDSIKEHESSSSL